MIPFLIFVIVTLVIVILLLLVTRGNMILKENIQAVETILRDHSNPLLNRIANAQVYCRNRDGIVYFAMYCILGIWKENEEKRK